MPDQKIEPPRCNDEFVFEGILFFLVVGIILCIAVVISAITLRDMVHATHRDERRAQDRQDYINKYVRNTTCRFVDVTSRREPCSRLVNCQFGRNEIAPTCGSLDGTNATGWCDNGQQCTNPYWGLCRGHYEMQMCWREHTTCETAMVNIVFEANGLMRTRLWEHSCGFGLCSTTPISDAVEQHGIDTPFSCWYDNRFPEESMSIGNPPEAYERRIQTDKGLFIFFIVLMVVFGIIYLALPFMLFLGRYIRWWWWSRKHGRVQAHPTPPPVSKTNVQKRPTPPPKTKTKRPLPPPYKLPISNTEPMYPPYWGILLKKRNLWIEDKGSAEKGKSSLWDSYEDMLDTDSVLEWSGYDTYDSMV